MICEEQTPYFWNMFLKFEKWLKGLRWCWYEIYIDKLQTCDFLVRKWNIKLSIFPGELMEFETISFSTGKWNLNLKKIFVFRLKFHLPGRRQAIIWTNGGILLIGPSGTNFSEIIIKIHKFSFKKMHLKMLSGKGRPFCFGPKVLKEQDQDL